MNLPPQVSGNYFVIVVADADNDAYEQAFEGNNEGSAPSPTLINLTPPPDLEVELVNAPATGLGSHALSVSYRVANNGATVTRYNSWHDRIYLSADTNFVAGEDFLLVAPPHYGNLEPGEFYMPYPVEVSYGGATVFVLDVARYERI